MISADIAQVLAEGGSVTLLPGHYLAEIEFARPVRVPLLLKVLKSLGWSEVTLDQSASDGTTVGAVPLAAAALKAAPAAAKTVASLAAKSAVVKTLSTPTSQAVKAVVQSQMTPAVQASVAMPSQPAAVLAKLPVTTSLATSLPIVKPSTTATTTAKPTSSPAKPMVKNQVTSSMLSALSTLKPGLIQKSAPTLPGAPKAPGGGGGSLSSQLSLSPIQAPGGNAAALPGSTDDASTAAPPGSDGGGGGGGGEAASAAPADDQAAPDDGPVDVPELWRRWKEWGSPFATAPMSPSTSGVLHFGGEDDGAMSFRFVGTLDHPLELKNVPGVSHWLFAHRIELDPFSMLKLQLVPHPLSNGKTYEMRFLSRIRSEPTRRAVCETLSRMGFQPMKLAALKKNMRMPGRPGASFTLWYGLGEWSRPDSVVVADDPFFFEDLQEIS